MYNYRIIQEQNLIVLDFSGPVGWRDVGQYFAQLLQDPEYHNDLRGICDLRGADMRMTADEAELLAEMAINHHLTRGRWAFLADTPAGTALAMIYSDRVQTLHESRHFSTTEAASEYLGIDLRPYLE